MALKKILVGLIYLNTILSVLVVFGWVGVSITGNVGKVDSAVLDSISVGVLWLIILTSLVFMLNLILFKRKKHSKF